METKQDPRYVVEQHLIPDELYSSGPNLLYKALGDVNSLMLLFYKKAGDSSETRRFEQTHKIYYRDRASVLVIRIQMPAPEKALQSRAIYLCYCDRNGENLYFTSELNQAGGFFLCCRPDSEKVRHLICCDAPDEAQKEIDLVADQYWELIFNDGLAKIEGLCAG